VRLIGRLAALLLLLQIGSQAKGDAFALELVRRDADDRLQEPTHFSPSDRFKALVTCPPEWRGVVGVIVYQDGKSYVPLAVQELESCGNRRALEGAFHIDGRTHARVCANFAASLAEWREHEADGQCAQLEPSAGD
jgi:hypothetical protein